MIPLIIAIIFVTLSALLAISLCIHMLHEEKEEYKRILNKLEEIENNNKWW